MDREERSALALLGMLLDLAVFVAMIALAADPELPRKVWYRVRLWYARWYHGRLDVRRRQEVMRRKVAEGLYGDDTYAQGSRRTDNTAI